MGLDFTLYTVTVNTDNTYTIREELYLSNSTGMLIVNWLYRNDSAEVTGNYLKLGDLYHLIDGGTLMELYENLEKVLQAPSDKKDNYALFYFPCLYTIGDWVNSIEMFSTEYYAHLEYLYNELTQLLEDKKDTTVFAYNISW